MQNQQLPTESQVFEGEVLEGAKSADDPPEEMPERHDHGKNIIGTIRIQLCAKSFILQMYDVLARYSSHRPNNKDLSIMHCRQRSTLRRPDFGPKDGEHLTDA